MEPDYSKICYTCHREVPRHLSSVSGRVAHLNNENRPCLYPPRWAGSRFEEMIQVQLRNFEEMDLDV